MKNGFFVALGVAIWGALKLVFKFLSKIIQLLTSLFIFLGLYIPLFYIVFGLILLATTSFTFGGTGTYQILYYVGLGLSCVAAVIIAVRNILVKPFSSVFSSVRGKSRDRYDDEPNEGVDPRYDDGRRPYDAPQRLPGGYYGDDRRPREGDYAPRGDYGYEPPRGAARDPYGYPPRDDYAYPSRGNGYAEPRRPRPDLDRYASSVEERPLVYYSQLRPGVLVEEYSDRFELFREDASGRVHIGTEYKED